MTKGREEIKICGEARNKVKEVLIGLTKPNDDAERRREDGASIEGQAGTRKRKRDVMRERQDRRIWEHLEQEVGQEIERA